MASIVCACAASEPGAEQPSLNSPGDTQAAAESLLGNSLRLNSAVHSAFGRVKANLEAEAFLLFDEIHRTLPQETLSNSQILDEVADELYPHMQMGEKDELAVNVYALVRRFAELISLPRESIPAQRLAAFLTDAIVLNSEMRVVLRDDRTGRKKNAYYFASAYNVVVSVEIFALAAAGYSRRAIEPIYLDAIAINLHLIGSGEGGDLGYLSDWVVAQTAGSASARTKLDKDPIIYSVRRSLEEQQHALE